MPKVYRKKKAYRPKKYRIKRRMFRRGMPLRNTRSFFYKQTVNGTTITGILSRFINQTISAQNIALQFRATDLPQWSTMSSLYDQYCLTKVVLRFVPMTTSNPINGSVAGANVSNPGVLASVIDYDDDTPLSALTDYQQYQTFKMTPAISTRTHKRVLTPYIRQYALNTDQTAYATVVKKKQWLDVSTSIVSHYGLKIYVDPYGTQHAPQTWQVFATYYIKFRNVR